MSNFSKQRALVLCSLAGSLWIGAAQSTGAQGTGSAAPSGFPQEPTTDLGFVMDTPTDTGFNANVQSRVVHDDNIFSNNAERKGDFVFEESALINLWDKQSNWNIGLQYQPTALFYQSASSLNAIDQQLKAQGEYHFTPKFHLAWSEAAEDRTSLLQPSSNQFFEIPVGPPPGLNDTVSTPLAREISSQTQGHAFYEPSYRTSWDLMGSYDIMTFSGIGPFSPDLLKTKGEAGGLAYQYRETQHFTVGARYLFENYSYGSESSDQVHSGYLTVLWNLGPHAMLSLFGGAQYSDAGGVLPFASPGQFVGKPAWVPAGGGSFTLKSDRTALQFAAQRLVTSGGGLLGTVTSAYGGVQLRRRMTADWDLVLTGSGAQTQQIQSGGASGNIQTQTAGIALEHAIFENLFFHGEYDFLRQRVNQFVPLGTDINRNQYTVSIFYAFGEHRL
jgi:hypothetical protein